VTGLLVPSENACALSRAISSLLHDRAKAKQMGLNGRQHVTQGWSLQSMVQGYEDLILQIYDSKVPRTSPGLSDTLRDSSDPRSSESFNSSDTVVDDNDSGSSLQQQDNPRCISAAKNPIATFNVQSLEKSPSVSPSINQHDSPFAAVNHLPSSSDPPPVVR